MYKIFLHGLDSSGLGTKGRYFSNHYPDMLRPDFDGPLAERLQRLDAIIAGLGELIVVGSSFGGLMGACLAISSPYLVRRLIMLAPALNFSEYRPPETKLTTEAIVIIGTGDTVTPPDIVIPAAEATFANLTTHLVEDDHLLHDIFPTLDWDHLLRP